MPPIPYQPATLLATALGISAAIGWPRDAMAGDPSGGALGLIQFGWSRMTELDGERPPIYGLGQAGVRLRGAGGAEYIQYAVGLDFRFGASVATAGLLYGFHLRPGGVSLLSGRLMRLFVTGGLGFDGVTEQVPFAFRLPIETLLELRLSDRIELIAWSEVAWSITSEDRSRTIGAVPFGDELSSGAVVSFGASEHEHRSVTRDGYFVGLTWTEAMGMRGLGSVLGYGAGIDFL